MKKRLIYQVNISIRGTSKLYDHCIESVRKYCEKYGIDHIVQTEPILNISPDMKRTNRNKNGLLKESNNILVIFEKENAFNYFQEYDQIAIIDADILIKETAPNIFEELTEEYDFGGVLERDLPLARPHRNKIRSYSREMFRPLNGKCDWDWNEDGAAFMNMGMMVMNKSIAKYFNDQTPEEFIRREEFRDFVDGVGLYKWSTDQVLLNYWIKKEKIRTKYMNWKWNALYTAVTDNKIKEAFFVHFFLKDKLPGKGENVKELMKNVF